MAYPVASDPVPPNASTARRTPRTARRGATIAGLLGLVLLMCCALSGCQGTASGDVPAAAGGHTSIAPSAGQVALSVPVELRQVLETAPCTTQNPSTTTSSPATTVLRDVDGVDCYQVTAPLMVFQQLDAITVTTQPPASQYVISMTLTTSDTQAFAALTAQHDRQQLAYVVRDTVLSAQTIAQPITNGVVQLQGNFSQDDANRLVRQITS